MKKLFASMLVIASLVGCAAVQTPLDKGYEFGDTTESILNLQVQYCTETNPAKRAVLLLTIRSAVPTYPASGACSKVADTVVEKLLEGVESETYEEYLKELEQAEKDALNFQESVV